MKVLLAVSDLDAASGGPAVVVTRLAAELLVRGHAVAIAHMVPHSDALQVAPPPGAELLRLPRARNPWQRFRQFRHAVDDAITHWGAQLIHDHGVWLPENAAAAVASRSRSCPFISQPCGMLQDWPFANQRLKKSLAWHTYQHRMLAHASAIVVTSAEELQETGRRLDRSQRLCLIPHGVDLPVGLAEAPHRVRRAVFLGRLDPKKQVHLLLQAWSALKPKDWQLALAGGGDTAYVGKLHELARQGGIANQVQFLGPVHGHAKSMLLSSSQLFLQPSLHENFGLSVAEAIAHGLPALTTTAMPWSELEVIGAGWSVAPTQKGVTAGLAMALKLPAEILAEMGQRARGLASRYSWAETAKQTVAVYEQVVKTNNN